VPTSIRGLALLSQLAVYKDLIPGYRIRQLTAAEESEKVRDEVRRLREGEKMLVRSYKGYLKMLENEIKRAYDIHPQRCWAPGSGAQTLTRSLGPCADSACRKVAPG
jgi:hypothetical protein